MAAFTWHSTAALFIHKLLTLLLCADTVCDLQFAQIDAARSEILGMLRKRKRHEATESLLVSRKLRHSKLGWQFHLQDMVGKGLLERDLHGSTVVYRICKR